MSSIRRRTWPRGLAEFVEGQTVGLTFDEVVDLIVLQLVHGVLQYLGEDQARAIWLP